MRCDRSEKPAGLSQPTSMRPVVTAHASGCLLSVCVWCDSCRWFLVDGHSQECLGGCCPCQQCGARGHEDATHGDEEEEEEEEGGVREKRSRGEKEKKKIKIIDWEEKGRPRGMAKRAKGEATAHRDGEWEEGRPADEGDQQEKTARWYRRPAAAPQHPASQPVAHDDCGLQPPAHRRDDRSCCCYCSSLRLASNPLTSTRPVACTPSDKRPAPPIVSLPSVRQ